MISSITMYLSAAMRMAMPLTLAGLGETVSERAGLVNIGLEAIMLAGAFFSFIVTFFSNSILLGMLGGIAGGLVVSLIHAVLSIRCKANQTIVGLALNFMVLGLTSFLFLMVFGQSTDIPACRVVSNRPIPLLSKIPILGELLFNQNIFVYIAFLLVIVLSILFYKTAWGINLKAVGEHPRAADSAGLNVFRIRYMAGIANGVLGGFAGCYISLAQLGFFQENVTSGKGYIAMVAVILGRRNPLGVFLASLVIGFADALQFNLQSLGIPLPTQLFTMFPYIVAVLVLLFSIGRSNDPASLGIPYERNKR